METVQATTPVRWDNAAPPAPPVIRCRGVAKDFGTGEAAVRALRGVDLEVFPGQMTLLAGPSGCGKTTLISIVAGLLEASEGEVHVLGVALARLTSRQKVDFRRTHVGFVFQDYHLLPTLTATENAALPLVAAGCGRRQALARAREVLVDLGMAHRAEALPAQMSGGQQQRVAIARALVHQPRLLVCDEPTAALDTEAGAKAMTLLRHVALQPDRAVVVVTHDSRVMRFGDRIAWMEDGQVVRLEDGPFTDDPRGAP